MNFSRLRVPLALACLALVFIGVGLYLRAWAAPEWWQLDPTQHPVALRPWAVEADCYSQLARVQRILHGQGLIQSHFTAENWPEGLIPSTTAPFDYVILLLYAPLALLTKYPLDWAGAIVSPALWLGLAAFWMLVRSREFTLPGRVWLVIGSSVLPAFVWATSFGRPRHQSLILFLMALGLTAEYERWHVEMVRKRPWHIFAGIIWGLAGWTSLFEPTLVVTLLVIFNLITRRRESGAFLISFGTVMAIALLLEGVHIYVPPADQVDALHRWLGTIAEVRSLSFGGFMSQLTLVQLAMPFVVWRLLARVGDRRTDWFLVILATVLTVLTCFQSRWLYYTSLADLFILARFIQLAPLHGSRLLVMAIFLAGVADSDGRQMTAAATTKPNQPSPELASVAQAIDAPGGILAPWWLSPGLLYFSGQPIVSGSSHCGISGIVDSAKFYAATSWVDAEQILRKRKVRWVVAYDDPVYVYPVLNTSCGILGLPPYDDDSKAEAEATVSQILINDRYVPTFLRLRAVTADMKLYEVVGE